MLILKFDAMTTEWKRFALALISLAPRYDNIRNARSIWNSHYLLAWYISLYLYGWHPNWLFVSSHHRGCNWGDVMHVIRCLMSHTQHHSLCWNISVSNILSVGMTGVLGLSDYFRNNSFLEWFISRTGIYEISRQLDWQIPPPQKILIFPCTQNEIKSDNREHIHFAKVLRYPWCQSIQWFLNLVYLILRSQCKK